MNPNLNDNPCVYCGEYAVEGSRLCWKCQQQKDNRKELSDYLALLYEKALDKKKKV